MKYPSFGSIDSQEFSNINHYSYKYLDTYLNMSDSDSRYAHMKANVIGEMYEYLIYEKLIKWAEETEEVDEFIIKGPHARRDNTVKEGFLYDAKNQIYYMSGGETIGEFDALFKYGKYRYFVEITQTENKPLIRNLRAGIIRKYNLMRILFPDNDVGCWVITTYQGQIFTHKVPNFKTLRASKYELDPDSLRTSNEAPKVVSPRGGKFKSAYQLRCKPFHLFTTLSRIHRQMKKTEPQEVKRFLRNSVEPYTGIIERSYIGKVSADNFRKFLENNGYIAVQNIQIQDAYFAVKIANDLSMKKVFYLKGSNNKYYELIDLDSMKLIKIHERKRSHREIRRLDKSLKKLDWQELGLYWTIL